MKFFKALLLAIVVSVLLTWALGISTLELLGIGDALAEQHINLLSAVSYSALAVVVIGIVLTVILVSVFGLIAFIGISVVAGLLALGVGMAWPFILVAFVIYFCTRERPIKAC
ncbi:hypothetical protein [Thalassotalea maritima]|uniref:hypothetical protein n=1 Tax=Thalassotalea maritima TaxID=3242416 RepID=UPI0035273698